MKTYQVFLVVSLFWYSILNAQTWQEIKRFNPEQTLHSIDFLDGQTGYTVGALYNNSNYNIHRTTDGGKTWIDQNSGYTGMRFMKIWYQDRDVCYMSSNEGIIIKTTDAGENWKTLTTGTKEQIWGLYFTDKNNGYACGSRGLIMKTEDAGETWKIIPNAKQNLLQSIFFTSKNIGFAAGSNIIFKTIDGGENWTEIKNFPFTPPADWIRKVVFPSDSIGYACADIGRIYKTTDGGDSWKTLNSGVQEALMDMDFVDDKIGVAVGFNGTIVRTTDGGLNWHIMPSPAGIDHNFGIDMVDANLAYISTHRGKILKIQNLTSSLDSKLEAMYLYPNPCSDVITLSSTVDEFNFIKMFSIEGQEVLHVNKEDIIDGQININDLQPGTYIFAFYQENGLITQKFTKI